MENQIPKVNHFLPSHIILLNRLALFIVFFWFGLLKTLAVSPAETIVTKLKRFVLPSISDDFFLLFLGMVECTIGVLWLVKRATKWVFLLFMAHMFTTFLPMVVLPIETWSHPFQLTLTGQYILKNLVLVVCAYTIYKSESSVATS